jgi:ribosomal protein L32
MGTGDWRRYEISLTDAKGYPICHSDSTLTVKAHLCPNCATRLAANIQPWNWPRSPVGTPPEPTPAVPA